MLGTRRIVTSLFCLLILAGFFRFYNWQHLQFWSPDDEVQTATIRKIIYDHQPVLVTPNAEITFSLGPFFHYLTTGVYLAAHMDPTQALFFGSILGIATTFLVLLTGNELFGPPAGWFAGLLYAGSFLTSLYDRRWWPMTLDPFLITLAILSLFKISQKKYAYFLPLAIAVSFSWHADPSLLVLVVGTVLTFWLLHLPVWRRQYLPGLAYLVVSWLPQLVFFVRHPQAFSGPTVELLHKLTTSGQVRSLGLYVTNLLFIPQAMSRFFFLPATNVLENDLCHCQPVELGWLSITVSIGIILLAVSMVYWLLASRKANSRIGTNLSLIFLSAFLGGIGFFSVVMAKKIVSPYFIISAPVVFLLAGRALQLMVQKFGRWPAIVLCLLFLIGNIYSLTNSQLAYPLAAKKQAADYILSQTSRQPFTLAVSGNPDQLESIAGVMMAANRFPTNRAYFSNWDWIYQAYSFYGREVGETPKFAVAIFPAGTGNDQTASFGNIGVSVSKLP